MSWRQIVTIVGALECIALAVLWWNVRDVYRYRIELEHAEALYEANRFEDAEAAARSLWNNHQDHAGRTAQCRLLAQRAGFADAAKQSSSAAYAAFLSRYPTSIHAAAAQRGLIECAQREIAEAGTATSAERILKRLPKILDVYRDHILEAFWRARLQDVSGEHDVEAYRQFCEHALPGPLTETAKDRLDTLTFEQARATGTADALCRYLDEFAGGLHTAHARPLADRLVFDEACSADTEEAYSGYLERFPNGTHAEESRRRRENALLRAARNAEDDDALKAFLREHPDSPLAESALHALDDRAWARAEKGNSEEACMAYLEAFPAGRHAREARRQIETFHFAAATALDSITAYADFLESHPNGDHATEAAQRLTQARLEVLKRYVEGGRRRGADVQAMRAFARVLGDALSRGCEPVPVVISDAVDWIDYDDLEDKKREIIDDLFREEMKRPANAMMLPGSYQLRGVPSKIGIPRLGEAILPEHKNDCARAFSRALTDAAAQAIGKGILTFQLAVTPANTASARIVLRYTLRNSYYEPTYLGVPKVLTVTTTTRHFQGGYNDTTEHTGYLLGMAVDWTVDIRLGEDLLHTMSLTDTSAGSMSGGTYQDVLRNAFVQAADECARRLGIASEDNDD